jgi:hypothetical protein
MSQKIISMIGIGSVIADIKNGTITPVSKRVSQRLLVGVTCINAKKSALALTHKLVIVAEAIRRFGRPISGWQWVDHTGSRLDS